MTIETNIKIVVARYNEDVSWLSDIQHDKIVYNKGNFLENTIVLKNIGREALTYLYHIVENYDNISEWTVFLQGNPFDHCKNIIEIINNMPHSLDTLYKCSNGCYPLAHTYYEESEETGRLLGVYPEELYKRFFISGKKIFRYASGAQYIVNKKNIINKSLKFYQDIIDKCNWYSHAPWSIERLWSDIFASESQNNCRSRYRKQMITIKVQDF